jgi:HprK-related kinase A
MLHRTPPIAAGLDARTARGHTYYLQIGPYHVSVESPFTLVRDWVATHYAHQLLDPPTPFPDFRVRISPGSGLRRFVHQQAIFDLDGQRAFKPLPRNQAYALFEWGLNYAIAQHAHHFLMLHAAVVEKGGRAIIMPGQPGSGKSTLCAALLGEGWRLLSDEFALLSPENGLLTALPRPVSIKNAAIDLIRKRMPEAVIGPIATDTAKGTVAHLKAPLDSVRRAAERAAPAWLVFPEYDSGASETVLAPLSKGRSLLAAAESSFNYDVLAVRGFETVADLVDRCDCYTLTYQDLDEALARIDELTAAPPPSGT